MSGASCGDRNCTGVAWQGLAAIALRNDGSLVRQRLNLEGRFVIGFVGTFKRRHGVDLLLSAFRELHSTDPSTRLLLAGDGPLRSQFELEVQKAGLLQAVTFAGALAHEDVPHYLAAMDIAVTPYPALDDFYFSDRKSTRLNSSHRCISYAVFCLKKKNLLSYKKV